MNLSLQGKYALICGGSQGIGLAVAKELASLGATCTLLARSEDNLKRAVDGLAGAFDQKHSSYAVDLSDHAALQKIIANILLAQPIHILINNSGGPAAGSIVSAKAEQFLKAFNQHLIANHLLTQAVTEGMKSEGYGRIVNIISTSVKVPLKNLGVSNTIRGAVASWAKTMANELGGFGITVNNVLPGFTRTQRLESLISDAAEKKKLTRAEVESEMAAEVPAGRFGDAAEVAAVAAFLCTPAAAYVNGASIPVDGGRTGSI